MSVTFEAGAFRRDVERASLQDKICQLALHPNALTTKQLRAFYAAGLAIKKDKEKAHDRLR